MATTKTALTITSTDLLTDSLSIATTATLTGAGNSTGLTDTTGLGRKTTSSVDQYTLYYGDQYTDNKAHKVYLKNISETAAEYFLISIDDEPIGRLYAGDWAFFPWSATSGVKAAFTVTFAATWAEDDTAVFDGVTITLGSVETPVAFAILAGAAKYPNFTAAVTSSGVVTFTAKDSNDLSLIEAGTASADYVVTTNGNGTGTVARTVTPVASANDIKITPSVGTAITLEHMLFHE